MNSIVKLVALAAIMVCAFSCTSGDEPLQNGVYFAEAQTNYNKKVSIDNTGAKASLSLRLAMQQNSDVTVAVDSKEATLDAYNKKYGTSLKMLPERLYTLSQTEFTIKGGKIGTSDLLNVEVLPFDSEIDPTATYAIPLSIESASGTDILEPAKSIVLVLDEIIVTNTYTGNANSTSTISVAKTVDNVTLYTVEYLIKIERFSGLLKHLAVITDSANKPANSIFSRFGNKGHVQDELQLNTCGMMLYPGIFAAQKWYHFAIVNTGAAVIFYVDGVQFGLYGHTYSAVSTYTKIELCFANQITFSEFRFWSKARTQAEIANNPYKIDPKTEGLEVYWKINEGSGQIVKDHTEKGGDGTIKGSGVWKSGQRFPADK